MKIGMIAASLSRLNGGVSEAVRLLAAALVAGGHGDIQLFTVDDAHLAQDRAQFGGLPMHVARGFGARRALWHDPLRIADGILQEGDKVAFQLEILDDAER